jgi:hypothetical protein
MGYKLSRSQIFVKVQEFNCGQMRALPTEAERRWVSGLSPVTKLSWVQEQVAKLVTNILILAALSALWARPYLFVSLPDNCLGILVFLFVFVLM